MKKLFVFAILLSNFFGHAHYTLIPDVNFEKELITQGIDSGTPDGKVLTANVSGITSLIVNSSSIVDLTGIQDFTNLLGLTCLFNQLTTLDVSKNLLLQSLDCTGNKLTILDLSKNKNLQFIDCGNNQLTNLDLSEQTGLTNLYCYSNPLKVLDVSKNIELLLLVCGSNQLVNLNISKNTKLRVFSSSNNLLTELDLSNNIDLSGLNCNYNLLTKLDLTKNKKLTSVSCNSNQLTALNLNNGNNIDLAYTGFNFNPNLSCIQVDNKTYSDTNWSSNKDATASYSENCNYKTAISPPIITATGNQIYCPGTSLKIVESFSITHDPAETETDAIYIQISSGYVFGQDQLTLNNPSLHPKITTSWSALEGKLKLYSPLGIKIPYTDFVSAIKDIVFNNSNISPSGIRNFSITIGQANFLPSTGHYYEYVSNTGITWTNAKTAAEALNYYGLKGYLATILSSDEAKLSGEQASGAGWIGGTDVAKEGEWRWVTGPEGLANGGTGIIFWNGLSNGSTPNFAFWNIGEPNQYIGRPENYAHIAAPGTPNSIPGSWNDLTNTGDTSGNFQPKGFVVEYGGMPGDPILQISASTSITIPKIEKTTPSSICGPGIVNLQATASNGTINWFNSINGGIPIATGNTYTTPYLSTTTSYFIEATNGNCPTTPRTEIIATIDPIPIITATTSASHCGPGTLTLEAATNLGTINWYDVSIGGSSLGTGATFTTPNITSSRIYYVEAVANNCKSATRTMVNAIINEIPSINSMTIRSVCDPGSVTIGATANTGAIRWYDSLTGGNLLYNGNSYTTPVINTTTTYYIEAYTATCTSSIRGALTVNVYNAPTILTTTPASICDSGTLTLGATASAGIINWYDVPNGGNPIGNGTSFTTPIINSTTTYYVEAVSNGCKSSTRTAIIASVTNIPTITATIPSSRCDSGTVTLEATSSSGVINWYNAPTGGTILGSGTIFTTPNITTNTTYYVEAVLNNCTSKTRTAIDAIVYPLDSKTQELVLCKGEMITLDASISGMNYLWSPGGETSQTITVSTIGSYNVTISSPNVASCNSTKIINVIENPAPIINSIKVNENSITIELLDKKDYYEYAINGIDFQTSNQFSYIPSGKHQAYVREKNNCNLRTQSFTIFTISKYFTPNFDGKNDIWEIKEMRDYPNSSAQIFDRYGKLLINLTSFKYWWDGKYNSAVLPSDDYWYRLKLDDNLPEITGHFTLKR